MSDWKVNSKEQTNESAIARPLSVGIAPEEFDYEIENEETGETANVTAFNEDDLGDKIGDGELKSGDDGDDDEDDGDEDEDE
jgi:hypothetical protein